MVREEIKKIIKKAIRELVPHAAGPEILVEKPKEEVYGDYATNVAMALAKKVGKSPMEIAEGIKSKIKSNIFEKIEIAQPGFINFFLSKEYLQKQVGEIFRPLKFSKRKLGRVNVEFISANPTGPLTLGNGRGGFCGDVLANVLEKAGYKVTREFYINDRGKQIEDFKKGLYKGEKRTVSQIQKENKKFIEEKLKIKFDVWFSENSLYKNKEADKVLDYLKKKKLTYQKEDALWFNSTKFGDDKDRVLIKSDGEKTYFSSDIAYLKNKFSRGFNKLLILLGADHYGYVPRMKAAVEALGYKKEQLDFIIFQLVRLLEKGKEIKMSKRRGRFITLEELINQVGLDVARFFFLVRAADSHLNFDMNLAKKKSEKNPVYYVQYAYARICSILRKTKAQNPKFKTTNQNLKLLDHSKELTLIKQLIEFPDIIKDTIIDYQIQRLPQYAIGLADAFHQFYENCRVICEDKKLSKARLALVGATKIVLKKTLDLIGVSAPEKM